MAGAGATRLTFFVDLVVILLFQVPLSIIVVAGFGASIDALFRCVAITNAFGALAYSFVYVRGSWKRTVVSRSTPPPAEV
jgi:Na+-driven multidrug efflux pump